MNNEDAELWRAALIAYCYPVSRVQVSCFARRLRLGAPWFTFNLEQGSRDQTIALEERFRGLGRDHIESWFEVIFWKLASTKRLGEWRAKEMIKRLRENKCVASSMWAACTYFVDSGSRGSFESLQR